MTTQHPFDLLSPRLSMSEPWGDIVNRARCEFCAARDNHIHDAERSDRRAARGRPRSARSRRMRNGFTVLGELGLNRGGRGRAAGGDRGEFATRG